MVPLYILLNMMLHLVCPLYVCISMCKQCTCLIIFSSILDPIVKEQGRLTMVSSSPTPMAGSVPVGE